MTEFDNVARALNTVGLAAWFGGSLMGAVALRDVDDGSGAPGSGAENDAWARWSPVQAAAIGAHLLGAAKLATTNKGRVAGQKGAGKVAVFKAVCTAGAIGATVYASRLGKEVHDASASSVTDLRSADNDHGPPAGASADTVRKLRAAQVAVPVLTGAMLVADARLGEQQRPTEVLRGMVARAVPDSIGDVLPSLPDSLTDVLPSPTTLAGVTAAVKGLPEAAKHLPDTARELVSH